MAAFGLAAREIEDMPEQAAERRSEDMQNPQLRHAPIRCS
jgi:hypothetical protein